MLIIFDENLQILETVLTSDSIILLSASMEVKPQEILPYTSLPGCNKDHKDAQFHMLYHSFSIRSGQRPKYPST